MPHSRLPHILLSPQPPWILCGEVPAPLEDADQPGSDVRLVSINGIYMSTESDMHDEFSEKWDFPGYYGRNWDAMYECLTDPSWAPAEAYVLEISHSSQLLSRQQHSLEVLLGVLSSAGKAWTAPGSRGWPIDERRVPFHTVLRDPELTDSDLVDLYSPPGVPVSVLSTV
ncbi:Barstar domain-containing protein [Frankia sp. Hr75.2]|nr:Barstar domain-containing protein [Frankia sp. Hr75.2]